MWLLDQGEKCLFLAVVVGVLGTFTQWPLAGQVAAAMGVTGIVLMCLGAILQAILSS